MQHEETGNQGNPQYVLPETTALVVIGCLDLLSTVYLVGTKRASELNPLMLWLLQTFGSNGFVLGKALLLGIPLMIAERARRHSPAFVRRALRIGIVLYLGLYAVGWLRYNMHTFFQ